MSADTTTVASPAAAVLGAQKLPHPVFELLRRYAAVFKAAWAARTELAGPQRLAHERAFLPAALSLQETPVHPAPRRAMWALMALVTAAIVWSCIGQLDIVAVAPGRVIVSDRTKLVQPLEAGVVKAIHVRDGDKVQAGQLLVELDPTAASADTRTVAEQLATARTQAEVAQRLLTRWTAARRQLPQPQRGPTSAQAARPPKRPTSTQAAWPGKCAPSGPTSPPASRAWTLKPRAAKPSS
jgi:hemolysin D